MSLVAIIDYGSGNLRSAAKAFERAARETEIDARILVTGSPREVRGADYIVLPGVGAFGDCRAGLDAIDGMIDTLEDCVRRKAHPFLGICVGMQLMATRGIEYGVHNGLGWIEGEVSAIDPLDPNLKIPHMGWNTLDPLYAHPLLSDIPLGDKGLHAYFVHSFAMRPVNESDVVARTDYGGPITAMVARDNMAGTQFHPEKSQTLGLKLIGNFLNWRP